MNNSVKGRDYHISNKFIKSLKIVFTTITALVFILIITGEVLAFQQTQNSDNQNQDTKDFITIPITALARVANQEISDINQSLSATLREYTQRISFNFLRFSVRRDKKTFFSTHKLIRQRLLNAGDRISRAGEDIINNIKEVPQTIVQFFEKVLELNPGNQDVIQRLKKLRQPKEGE